MTTASLTPAKAPIVILRGHLEIDQARPGFVPARPRLSVSVLCPCS